MSLSVELNVQSIASDKTMKKVYQLSDLSNREILDHGAEKPAKLAVIGYPVEHSSSPQMHQAALDAMGMDIRYIRLELKEHELAPAITQMQKLGFYGCNVTVPHKLNIIKECKTLSSDAQAMGVVNTIHFNINSSHTITGHNTDAYGLIKAIKDDFSINVNDLKVMILGTGGGAGRAAATQCARIGCQKLWLINRTLAKAQDLAKQLQNSTELKIHALEPNSKYITNAINEVDLIINDRIVEFDTIEGGVNITV